MIVRTRCLSSYPDSNKTAVQDTRATVVGVGVNSCNHRWMQPSPSHQSRPHTIHNHLGKSHDSRPASVLRPIVRASNPCAPTIARPILSRPKFIEGPRGLNLISREQVNVIGDSRPLRSKNSFGTLLVAGTTIDSRFSIAPISNNWLCLPRMVGCIMTTSTLHVDRQKCHWPVCVLFSAIGTSFLSRHFKSSRRPSMTVALHANQFRKPLRSIGLFRTNASCSHHRNGPLLFRLGFKIFGFSASTSASTCPVIRPTFILQQPIYQSGSVYSIEAHPDVALPGASACSNARTSSE